MDLGLDWTKPIGLSVKASGRVNQPHFYRSRSRWWEDWTFCISFLTPQIPFLTVLSLTVAGKNKVVICKCNNHPQQTWNVTKDGLLRLADSSSSYADCIPLFLYMLTMSTTTWRIDFWPVRCAPLVRVCRGLATMKHHHLPFWAPFESFLSLPLFSNCCHHLNSLRIIPATDGTTITSRWRAWPIPMSGNHEMQETTDLPSASKTGSR